MVISTHDRRYSAEHVVYRELMQNSDDAGSQAIQIRFNTAESPLPGSKIDLGAKVARIVFRNNGMPFRQEDWNRLKKIAEGNPDEQKVSSCSFFQLLKGCLRVNRLVRLEWDFIAYFLCVKSHLYLLEKNVWLSIGRVINCTQEGQLRRTPKNLIISPGLLSY